MPPESLPIMMCMCGHIGVPTIKEGRSVHVVAAWCSHCNAFLKWLPRRLLPQAPPPPPK
jgi:hypothetical protein